MTFSNNFGKIKIKSSIDRKNKPNNKMLKAIIFAMVVAIVAGNVAEKDYVYQCGPTVEVDGTSYQICNPDDESNLQQLACLLHCRSKFAKNSECKWYKGKPICECIFTMSNITGSISTSTTTTTETTTTTTTTTGSTSTLASSCNG